MIWANLLKLNEVLNSSSVVIEAHQFQYNQSEPITVVVPTGWSARTKSYTSNNYAWMTAYVKTLTTISTFWAVAKRNSDWISIFPIEQKSLTNTWKFTITWLVEWDNWPEIYKWDYNPFKEKSNSATTWSVSLWNAVWFLTVDIWWEKVKIPYYNE